MRIFTGGSWAVGEFDRASALIGPGVAQYFALHDDVINLSKGHSSCLTQIEVLNNFLNRFVLFPSDTVYWLVHNPLIDIPAEEIYKDQTSLAVSIENILIKNLEYADTIAEKHKIIINLIGASCDLNTIKIDQFKNLTILVPSWGKLINELYPTSIFARQTNELDLLKLELEKYRPDLIPECESITGMAFSKRKFMLTVPDKFASFHPTSLAHKQLRDYLCPELAHIF